MLNIIETAVVNGSFTTFLNILDVAGMLETLSERGPFTVFAPTDNAFDDFPSDALDGILNHPLRLRAIVMYHVVPRVLTSREALDVGFAKTMQGEHVQIEAGEEIFIDGGRLSETDIFAHNGVIHAIDTVLLPYEERYPLATQVG